MMETVAQETGFSLRAGNFSLYFLSRGSISPERWCADNYRRSNSDDCVDDVPASKASADNSGVGGHSPTPLEAEHQQLPCARTRSMSVQDQSSRLHLFITVHRQGSPDPARQTSASNISIPFSIFPGPPDSLTWMCSFTLDESPTHELSGAIAPRCILVAPHARHDRGP